MQSLQQVMLLTGLLANLTGLNFQNSGPSSTAELAPQFTVPASSDQGAHILPNIHDPQAVLAQEVCPGYLATSVDVSDTQVRAKLVLAGEPCNLYGNDVHDLDFLVEYQAQERLHISITPTYVCEKNESWFVLPEAWVPAPQQEQGASATSAFTFSWTNTPTFGFNVTRRDSQDVLFDTIGSKLVFADQFIEFVTAQDFNYNLYGLGETFHSLRLGNNLVRPIYAADYGDPIDQNAYGSHPFYLQTKYWQLDAAGDRTLVVDSVSGDQALHGNYSSTSHGVYLRNAHGMEVLMNPSNVTWRTIGGNIDMFIFAGPTQPAVTQQYLSQIGLPALQQYWTFGFHQSRWGYQNWSMTEQVVDDYAKFGIPLETIWNDIDYMKGYRDFENDPVRFDYQTGREFLQRLHDRGQHYVPIIDSAIYAPNPDNASDAYPPFSAGYDAGAYLLNPDGSLYIGAVWPGYTVFPDWSPASDGEGPASAWWIEQISEYLDKLPIDGIWIDMSEVASFCVGSCGSKNLSYNPVHPYFQLPGESGNLDFDYPEGFEITNATEAAAAIASALSQAAAVATPTTSSSTSYLRTTPTPGLRNVNHPPYAINHVRGDLAIHAVSPNATHHNGVQEYDVHNLYGHQILQNTYAALSSACSGTRPFIIGRSNFVGSGNYSGHWGGDNRSLFSHMYFSIPQALSFSLFGIPMFGVDACGFGGNTDLELCSRWMQLAAFFPFYRNHNVLGAIDQEAYRWSDVAAATKAAMDIRFQLLPYLYTLFHKAHTCGDTVMRALAWEFPNDPSLADADRQFLLGSSIMIIPVLEPNASTVDGVFPGLIEGTERYYDWYNQTEISVPIVKNSTIDAPLGHIPVYIRGGVVLATQPMEMTTRAAREADWSLIVALDVHGRASGHLYLDDGESLTPNATKHVYYSAEMRVDSSYTGTNYSIITLNVTIEGTYSGLDNPLDSLFILGVHNPLRHNNAYAVPEMIEEPDRIMDDQTFTGVVYDAAEGKVRIKYLQELMGGIGLPWGRSWTMTVS